MATSIPSTEPADDDLARTYLYHQLDEYPWAMDQEFQGGLRAILGSVDDPARIEHLTLRAKCYYYARKAGTPVDFDGYRQWVETLRDAGAGSDSERAVNGTATGTNAAVETPSRPTTARSVSAGSFTPDGDGGLGDAPKPASFAEICALIAEGKPIPGIKDIPDTILEGKATESHVPSRRKPWEKAAQAQVGTQVGESPSWMTKSAVGK